MIVNDAGPDISTHINYITWDHAWWSAKASGTSFVIAPDGDWRKQHADASINYIAWDGAKWSAKPTGSGFSIAPDGNWSLGTS